MTVNVAEALVALFPLLVCKEPARRLFVRLPPVAPVTVSVTVQNPLAGIESPTGRDTLEVVVLTVPTHVVLALPDVVMPLGSVSVNGAVRVETVLLGLVKVIVSVEVPPRLIVDGVKDLLNVGGVMTVKVAEVAEVLLPSSVTNAPIGSVLMLGPLVLEMTSTCKLQDP